MIASRETQAPPDAAPALEYDAIIIGAGMSGMYQLHRLREQGMRVRVFEAGTGVGGTWYWNRYPGARFDSESYSYGYSFSQELLDEWNWSEHFAPQPETLRYLNFVADKFGLRSDIRFHSRVSRAHYQDETDHWDVTVEDGDRYRFGEAEGECQEHGVARPLSFHLGGSAAYRQLLSRRRGRR
jgi:cation diffusion facilitator CzcD-associated flavoprotein CzcO